MIDTDRLAFDIDGVVADTMRLFLDIAREEHNVRHLRYDDITSYSLEECLDLAPELIETIVTQIMDGTYTATLRPVPGAAQVLARLGQVVPSVLFVTARPYPGPILDWIRGAVPLAPDAMEVVTTGSFSAKADVLQERGIRFFVEDRLETCFLLDAAGITPVLFRQPWNRREHPFVEVGTWQELETLIAFP